MSDATFHYIPTNRCVYSTGRRQLSFPSFGLSNFIEFGLNPAENPKKETHSRLPCPIAHLPSFDFIMMSKASGVTWAGSRRGSTKGSALCVIQRANNIPSNHSQEHPRTTTRKPGLQTRRAKSTPPRPAFPGLPGCKILERWWKEVQTSPKSIPP